MRNISLIRKSAALPFILCFAGLLCGVAAGMASALSVENADVVLNAVRQFTVYSGEGMMLRVFLPPLLAGMVFLFFSLSLTGFFLAPVLCAASGFIFSFSACAVSRACSDCGQFAEILVFLPNFILLLPSLFILLSFSAAISFSLLSSAAAGKNMRLRTFFSSGTAVFLPILFIFAALLLDAVAVPHLAKYFFTIIT